MELIFAAIFFGGLLKTVTGSSDSSSQPQEDEKSEKEYWLVIPVEKTNKKS
jgi:hypothetical protein